MATATYEPIATTTLGSAAASITFSSIAATWTDLRVVLTGTTGLVLNPRIQFNSDTGNNYSYTYMRGDGASTFSGRGTTTYGLLTLGNMNDTTPTTVNIDVFSYAGSTYKTVLSAYALDVNGSGSVGRNVVLWRNTAAITTVTLDTGGSTFKAGTTATLYGIKAA